MSTLDSLPEKMILRPIQFVPLPRHYHFAVDCVPGWQPPRRDALVLFIDTQLIGSINKQDEAGDHGFNELLQSLLGHAKSHNLWEQTVQCQVIALGGPAGLTYVARSNPQPLRFPVRPLADIAINQYPWTVLTGDTPPPFALAFPNGRRLYRRIALGGGLSALAKLWYVKPDGSLEDAPAARGFDRLTFWQAIFGMSLKETRNLASVDVMAKLLNAHATPPVPATGTLDAMLASVPNYHGLGQCLLWTQTRFVCVRDHGPNTPFAMEFDNFGFHSEPLQSWLTNENKSVVWSYRKFKSPTPAPAAGLLSLP